MKSILDSSFRYTKAAETTPEYLRAKLRRIGRQMQQERERNLAEAEKVLAKKKIAGK